MNKMDLVEQVAQATELSKAAAAAAIDAVMDGITEALKKGDDVRLVGFGTFSVKARAAATGRNPATGAEIQIPASNNARFKQGTALKAAINEK
jgi:DNA-binding protein HU-beta